MKIQTMTVGELKKKLEEFSDDLPIGFLFPAHDYWKSELFGEMKEVQYEQVVYSEYHQSYRLFTEHDDEKEIESVIILK